MKPTQCGCDEFRWRRMLTRRRFLRDSGAFAALGLAATGSYAGALAQDATPTAETGGRIEFHTGQSPLVNDSYISPLVELFGEIEVGQRSFIASNTVLFAGEQLRISLGDENNCQDNAYLFADESNLVFGNMVSIAHQAVIHDSIVGDFTFFGFRSRTFSCEIGEGAMIMHNTIVQDVVIPPNRITPLGVRITSQAAADALPEITEANEEFKHGVQHVNLEFAEAYTKLYQELGRTAMEGVGPNPITSFTPVSNEPQIGANTALAELVRIVGDVRIGEGSIVGQRSAIRADEGTPISIGRRARIQSRVTFHALEGTALSVGDNARIGDGNVIHGPLSIGDNFASEDDCVVFLATIEDNVTLRSEATVAGNVVLREGTVVPEGAVVITQEEADALPTR